MGTPARSVYLSAPRMETEKLAPPRRFGYM